LLDFKRLFEESPDVLLVLLPDAPRFTIVGATRSRLVATHTTEAQFGRGLFEVFPDNPDDPAATGTANLRASLERVLATRKADTMAVQKYDIRGPDGTFQARYWSPKNLPVLSEAGEILYILHRVEDVTELIQATELGEELRGRTREMEREVVKRSQELAAANRELRDANEKLGRLDAAKTAFFSNVSHEFRTPLTLMLGPLEDLLADSSLDRAHKSLLQMAHDNALRLLKLVNALLDFSRLEAGRLKAHYAPLDISGFTAELAGMFASAADKAGLRLVVDCPRALPPAWIDRDMWEKVISNLLSNAFKFTLAGEISVELREAGERFVLRVADTGVGIPEAELPRIFERFYRVAGTTGRTHEGAGIGLSLVRELVQLHGGRIEVESRAGRGSVFRVEIPKGFAHLPADAVSQSAAAPHASRDAAAHAVEVARWMAAPAETPADAGQPAAAGQRQRVLVVDDNADLREYVAGLLSSAYDVVTAADGLAALEAIRARRPDIVVSDVMMPRLDGLALVRALRELPDGASLPVILLSARAGEEAAVGGLDAGCDDYLVKPFSARELVARVRTHLALARDRRAFTEQLRRANQELDAFSYAVSHDLRAPLRAIDGFSRILAQTSSAVLDAQAHHHLQRIREGVRGMTVLIDALLELSQLSRAKMCDDEVDLSSIARRVVKRLRDADPARAVAVTVQDGLVARGDARLLEIALSNLLGNAWKYTSRVPAACVEFGGEAGDELTCYVRDNGTGFDMAFAHRLFVPFSRLHDANEFEGTGIGLATVRRVVSRHGGRIWAEAAPGRGATFFLTLPSRAGHALSDG
jgi:signal transduction histidine kinase